eukprot:s1288_g4.t1
MNEPLPRHEQFEPNVGKKGRPEPYERSGRWQDRSGGRQDRSGGWQDRSKGQQQQKGQQQKGKKGDAGKGQGKGKQGKSPPGGQDTMTSWLKSGKISDCSTFVDGFENLPEGILGLFKGNNIGKMLVRVPVSETTAGYGK